MGQIVINCRIRRSHANLIKIHLYWDTAILCPTNKEEADKAHNKHCG